MSGRIVAGGGLLGRVGDRAWVLWGQGGLHTPPSFRGAETWVRPFPATSLPV